MARNFNPTVPRETLNTVSGAISGLTGPFNTIGVWVWVDNDPTGQENITHSGSTLSAGINALQVFAPGSSGFVFGFTANGSSLGRWKADADISVGAWHHLCVVYDNAPFDTEQPVMYVDGSSVAFTETSNPSGTASAGQDTYRIGANIGASGVAFDGSLAELVHYNVLLSANEVAALAGGVSPFRVRPEALKFYVPIYGEAFEPELVQGIAITVNNAPTQVDHPPVQTAIPGSIQYGFFPAAAPPAGANPHNPFGHAFRGPFGGPLGA